MAREVLPSVEARQNISLVLKSFRDVTHIHLAADHSEASTQEDGMGERTGGTMSVQIQILDQKFVYRYECFEAFVFERFEPRAYKV